LFRSPWIRGRLSPAGTSKSWGTHVVPFLRVAAKHPRRIHDVAGELHALILPPTKPTTTDVTLTTMAVKPSLWSTCGASAQPFFSARGCQGVAKCPKAGRLRVTRLQCRLAVTPWLNRRLPSAGPKSNGLFCELSLLFACLGRSDASRAPSSCVCAAQPHTHQRILLQPRIRHRVCSLQT
jgi:hypothetical protein